MADTEQYGKRYLVNAALVTIVLALGWLWFRAHVRPYVSTFIFSGVNFLALFGFGATVFGSMVDTKAFALNLRRFLDKKTLTIGLIGALPLLAFAYLTTFTLYLTSAHEFPDVRLNVRRGASSQPVTLSPTANMQAVTYFGFSPIVAHIETLAPSGFEAIDLPLRRGFPRDLTVPEGRKDFYLIRLVPMYDLFGLRGRETPDSRYKLRVSLPGAKPIERTLSFSALYLGASLADLRSESKAARNDVNELRDKLSGLDSDMKGKEIDAVLADWLDNPQFIPTRELKPGSRVMVVVDSPNGHYETTVNVTSPLNTVLLRGTPE